MNVASNGSDAAKRKAEAEERKRWEASRTTSEVGATVSDNVDGRSALSRRRASNNGKPDFMMSQIDGNLLDPREFAANNTLDTLRDSVSQSQSNAASIKVSEQRSMCKAQLFSLVSWHCAAVLT